MVQQLSLFSSINDEAYDLFLATMTTSFGSAPIMFANLSTVWKPDPNYEVAATNTKNQLIEQTRIKVSKDMPLELITNINGKIIDYKLLPILNTDTLPVDPILIDKIINNQLTTYIDNSTSSNWAFAISDIPAAGSNRKVSMQTITESIILETAGPNASLNNFMKELYYVSDYQYLTLGVKFHLRHNIIVELQKVWDVNSKNQVTKNGYLIKIYTNANKSTNLDQINHGEQLLLNIQKDLQGYVDLKIPDRKSMDSRMEYDNNQLI
ncbi:mediator of RNA polymerase II transcription subunit 18 [Monosporozyma servazzii]